MGPPYTDIEAYGLDLEGEQITKEQDEEIMKKKERQVHRFILYTKTWKFVQNSSCLLIICRKE